MKETHIGAELAFLRKGKLSQAAIAEAMGFDQSQVSRIEADPKPDHEDARKYLAALNGDPAAKELKEYLESGWPNLGAIGKPAYRHPYRHELGMAEAALGKLQKFISAPNSQLDLVQQAKQYEASLREVAAFLLDLKHNFAFVGNIAVGKTTALCYFADLLIQEATTQKQKMALDTGAGYTTQGEVRVSSLDSGMEQNGKFGLVIYPHPKEEVFRLASDICTSFLKMREGKENESRVQEEVEKVLRVMAGLPRTASKEHEGELDDPLIELAKVHDTPEKLTAEFQSRMNLPERTTTNLWFDAPSTQEGLIWLRDEFRKVNSGRNPKVSLAKRIDVFVSMPLIPDTPYEISPIDTKGAEETAVRPDLQAHYDDPRAITILSSHFAPDSTMIDVLAHLAATGKGSAISERLVFMVLAREKETLTMNSEDGSPIEDVKQAYALREAQIRSKLAKHPGGKDVPIIFYDSVEEDPAPIREKLLKKLAALRAVQATRLREIVAATDDLVSKFQDQQAQKGFKKLRSELRQFVETYRELPARAIPVQSQLLSALKHRHPRTVWASSTRNGDFYNLDSYERVATAANMDAKTRSDAAIAALNKLLAQLSQDPECAAITSHLTVLQKDVPAWHLKFLDEVKNRSQEIFRAVLFPDNKVWSDCKGFWGKGLGFRDNVALTVQDWLKLPSHDWIDEAVEGLVRKDWQDFFLAPIQEQTKEPPSAP
jgi:transcriptional regulator with XRE-family HTH domain